MKPFMSVHFDLGRFDERGRFASKMGRFDWGRFDYGTFCKGDVLTRGRFDLIPYLCTPEVNQLLAYCF